MEALFVFILLEVARTLIYKARSFHWIGRASSFLQIRPDLQGPCYAREPNVRNCLDSTLSFEVSGSLQNALGTPVGDMPVVNGNVFSSFDKVIV